MDDLGRYTLKEMREMARRNVLALKAFPITTDGKEQKPDGSPSDYVVDRLVTDPDLNFWLNTALTNRCISIFYNAEKVLSDEETINVLANVIEYELPADLGILRSAWWKDPRDLYTIVPPVERVKMDFYEGDEDFPDTSGRFEAPSYRRQLNFLVLNQVPDEDNPQGILVKYIKWINPLVQDDTIIETEFARILQEIIVIDASIMAASRHRYLDTAELRKDQVAMEANLLMYCRISSNPSSVRLITDYPIKISRGAVRRSWRR